MIGWRALTDDASARRPVERPWAYLITFSCYGTRLHGRDPYSVDRRRNGWKTPYLSPSASLHQHRQKALSEPPAKLNNHERETVLEAIIDVCEHDGFDLHAAHVRSDHVHVVVGGDAEASRILQRIKVYSSRALNRRFGHKKHRWTTHGSTVHLWHPQKVSEAVDYVVNQQGRPMAHYVQ